jgi:hypothetical protein
MDTALRPMSTSQVLDRTFHLYRNNFLLFVGIAILAPALSLVAGFIQLAVFGVPVMPQPGVFDLVAFEKLMVQSLVGLILGGIFYLVGQAFATGATMHAVSMVHLGRSTTIRESYATIRPMLWGIFKILVSVFFRAFWLFVLSYGLLFGLLLLAPALARNGGEPQLWQALVVGLGFLLSSIAWVGGVVWGVYAYARYSLAIPAGVLEKLTTKNAIARSKFLTQGSLGRIIAVYLLTAVMGFGLTGLLQLPGYIGSNIFSMKGGAHISASLLFWSFFGSFVGRALAGPVATMAVALIYYDERVRKEAFDLQLMMEAIGPSLQQQATGVAAPHIG